MRQERLVASHALLVFSCCLLSVVPWLVLHGKDTLLGQALKCKKPDRRLPIAAEEHPI